MDMNELLRGVDCACGRRHSCAIGAVYVERNVAARLPGLCEGYSRILLVADENTYGVSGAGVEKYVGSKIADRVIFTGKRVLIPNEDAIEAVFAHMEGIDLIVGIGSGVIQDLCKYVSFNKGVPYYIVATAPSMDGYVSDGAPIISCGYKHSPLAHLAYGVIGDTNVLETAPYDLIQAGFGDVVGKITALADWDLAVKANGDYICDTCVTLTQRALEKCFGTAEGIKEKNPESLQNLFEALTLTGVAMALVNISRPASGAEHMLSHYWEMDFIARGLNPNHHGIQVGIATGIIARYFEELSDLLPEGVKEKCPHHTEIEKLLKIVDAPVSPREIGISRELFYQSLLNGHTVRPRYSILQFAHDRGLSETIARKITDEIYGA